MRTYTRLLTASSSSFLRVGKIEEALSSLKLDQDVDVALLVHLAPDDGAEEGLSLDAVLSQYLSYCVPHGLHLIGHRIPGAVNIFVPFYSVGGCVDRPDSF